MHRWQHSANHSKRFYEKENLQTCFYFTKILTGRLITDSVVLPGCTNLARLVNLIDFTKIGWFCQSAVLRELTDCTGLADIWTEAELKWQISKIIGWFFPNLKGNFTRLANLTDFTKMRLFKRNGQFYSLPILPNWAILQDWLI